MPKKANCQFARTNIIKTIYNPTYWVVNFKKL